MTTADDPCASIVLRLVAGERPGDDPTMAAHVGSCLRCFRAAGDMRELPELAALLRQDPSDDPDPGQLFWARFPTTVATAWEKGRATVSAGAWTAAWQAITGWLRRPWPAALAGATVAATMVLVLLQRSGTERGDDRVRIGGAAVEDELPAADVIGDEDPLELLDMADLKAAVAQGDATSNGTALDDGTDVGSSAAEEVEQLDSDDLPVVAQVLRGRNRI